MQHWTQQYSDEWLESVNDNPSKLMITLAQELCQDQEHRLEQIQGKLDGQLWQGKVAHNHSKNIY